MGISGEGCILDLGLEHNIVSKSGSFFSYGDTRLGQGRHNAKGFLRENPQMAREIELKVYDAAGVKQPGTPGAPGMPPVAEADAIMPPEVEPEVSTGADASANGAEPEPAAA
jgi:recombination protein RecA